jgi:hypothetical protein
MVLTTTVIIFSKYSTFSLLSLRGCVAFSRGNPLLNLRFTRSTIIKIITRNSCNKDNYRTPTTGEDLAVKMAISTYKK